MARKRPNQQVTTDTLLACQGNGAIKTRIVYTTGLNFKLIRPYIQKLAIDGLLEIAPDQIDMYRTIQKGLKCRRI